MIEITRHYVDYYCGQHDYRLIAKRDGETVGSLDFSIFEDVPYVKMIEAFKPRSRIGSQLVLHLQEAYPETPIQFGNLTEDGAALLDSFEWNIVPNAEYHSAKRELEALEQRLSYLTEKSETLNLSDQREREAFLEESSDWNEVGDRADEIREVLRRIPSEFRFVVSGKPERTTLTPAFGM